MRTLCHAIMRMETFGGNTWALYHVTFHCQTFEAVSSMCHHIYIVRVEVLNEIW